MRDISMYKILIVDDEIAERDGVKFLLSEYKLPLCIIEASDGEMAWEYLKKNRVDILFTDIKMPFMDGLQLSAKARELYPNIKIIIFSAYDQFQYAKEAIRLNVVNYILKPVIIDEFLEVINKVVKDCENDFNKKSNEAKVLEKLNKVMSYEREKVLLDLISGAEITEDFANRMDSSEVNFKDKSIQLVMFDFKAKFFDKKNDFKNLLKNFIKSDYEFVNLNEKQSIIFIQRTNKLAPLNNKIDFWNEVKNEINRQYGVQVCIVVGQWLNSVGDIHNEYTNIEQVLDFKFFFDEGIVLSTQNDSSEMVTTVEDVDEVLRKIYEYIDNGDSFSAEKMVEIFFDNLKRKGSLSSLFVKYTCTEIVKKLLQKFDMEASSKIKERVEIIFKSETLYNLKEQMTSIFSEIRSEKTYLNDEFNSKVINTVLKTIHDNYMNDISLESIADKVYLSPAYLSSIFKRSIGQSVIKYITAYRLEKAKELITDTNMKIVDIAKNVGYLNFSYFCWVFRTYFGVSPTKFRKNGN